MPYSENSKYRPPFYLFNKHLETIYPAIFRKVSISKPKRERLELSDGDFLDLDWFKNDNTKLVIINHGLEGSSNRPYMLGMANAFFDSGWDALTWNFRGCSEDLNRLPRFYHSGETGDMNIVVNHSVKTYDKIFLVGFSLGGNLLLKYLGEKGVNSLKQVIGAAVFSVPIHLHSSCLQIMKSGNILYQKRFLNNLKKKALEKSNMHPNTFDIEKVIASKTILEFDEHLTAPLHGFKNAIDYYDKSSAIHYLERIKTPTLLVNAKNDPMLSKLCYPVNQAKSNDQFHFEKWKHGGHVGFYCKGKYYSSEQRAVSFAHNILIENQVITN